MACIAWTKAQLALMQSYLDAKMPYRAAAAEIRTKHKLPITHNVIAALVKRNTLRRHPDATMTAPGSRLTVKQNAERLTLIKQAYGEGNTSATLIASATGISVHVVWRSLRRLGLKTTGHEQRRHSTGERTPRKRSKTRRKPREYINDPVSNTGVHFLDKRPNNCNFIVAKDPQDGLARYCDGHRVMRGPYFASAYCTEHHLLCHKIEFLEAAE